LLFIEKNKTKLQTKNVDKIVDIRILNFDFEKPNTQIEIILKVPINLESDTWAFELRSKKTKSYKPSS